MDMFRPTLDHNYIIERRNQLQLWLNTCMTHLPFQLAFMDYLSTSEPKSTYVYWMGSSKVIEYNLKMESFRL